MGSYGIGLERLLAAIIETHHDEWGIIWPVQVAPFDAHIVVLGSDPALVESAAALEADLCAAGYEVLVDDRAESPGVKFADADLIGIPIRLTVSAKAQAKGGVEVKRRDAAERLILPAAEIPAWMRAGALP